MSSDYDRMTAACSTTDEQVAELRRVAESMGAIALPAGFSVLGREALAANPIPLAGQAMVNGLIGEVRMGDGVTPWSQLPSLRAMPYADHPDYREEWRP